MAASAHRHCLVTETADITPSEGREQRRCDAVRLQDVRVWREDKINNPDDFLMVQVIDQVLTD